MHVAEIIITSFSYASWFLLLSYYIFVFTIQNQNLHHLQLTLSPTPIVKQLLYSKHFETFYNTQMNRFPVIQGWATVKYSLGSSQNTFLKNTFVCFSFRTQNAKVQESLQGKMLCHYHSNYYSSTSTLQYSISRVILLILFWLSLPSFLPPPPLSLLFLSLLISSVSVLTFSLGSLITKTWRCMFHLYKSLLLVLWSSHTFTISLLLIQK